MSRAKGPQTLPKLLEELRAIAQLGLNYTRDAYDRERYERLLELAAREYSQLCALPEGAILDRFRRELGHVTPKVGVDAAIFSEEGRLLLTRRADDGLWCLPCGWAEVGETPEESIRREVWEETGLEVEVGALIGVFSRLPGAFGQPHTSYHLVYHCAATGGTLTTSSEAVEVGFFDPAKVTAWHCDHQTKAEAAQRFWRERS